MDKCASEPAEQASALEQKRLEILRREIMIGVADVANGRLSNRTIEEIAADVAESMDESPSGA
jgi:hypothetical protein